jgi:hypothetical protein
MFCRGKRFKSTRKLANTTHGGLDALIANVLFSAPLFCTNIVTVIGNVLHTKDAYG